MMADHSRMARALADTYNESNARGERGIEVMARLSGHLFGEDDPDTRFYRWIAEAQSGAGLREAAAHLGLDVVEGAGFIDRLREAYHARSAQDADAGGR